MRDDAEHKRARRSAGAIDYHALPGFARRLILRQISPDAPAAVVADAFAHRRGHSHAYRRPRDPDYKDRGCDVQHGKTTTRSGQHFTPASNHPVPRFRQLQVLRALVHISPEAPHPKEPNRKGPRCSAAGGFRGQVSGPSKARGRMLALGPRSYGQDKQGFAARNGSNLGQACRAGESQKRR